MQSTVVTQPGRYCGPGAVRAAMPLMVAGLIVVVGAGLFALAPATASAGSRDAHVFTHSAKSGKLVGGRLTLRGVGRRITWANNYGRSGVMPIKRLHRLLFAPRDVAGHRHPPCRGPPRRRRARAQAEPAALQGIARDSELPGQAAEQAPPASPTRSRVGQSPFAGSAPRRCRSSARRRSWPATPAATTASRSSITRSQGPSTASRRARSRRGMATRGSRTPPTPRWAPSSAPVTGYIGNRAAQAPTIPAAPTPAPGRSLRTPQAGVLPSTQESQSPSACRCPRTTSSTTAARSVEGPTLFSCEPQQHAFGFASWFIGTN